jgi:hypothetical protein
VKLVLLEAIRKKEQAQAAQADAEAGPPVA